MNTPLWEALNAHVVSGEKSFHTPGHKNGSLIPQQLEAAWGEAVWRFDATEIPGLDNLAHPDGVLKESMAAWAEARGAAAVRYSLSGTSIGLKAALYGLCRGQEVFVPRHAHSSIYQGIVLAGATPIFLPLIFDEALNIPIGVDIEAFRQISDAHPTCKHMVVVHPTYHGITAGNAELFREAKARGIITIVDAAHGAHFAGLDQIDDALSLGGDVVVESAHKTLPCMTQASVLLIGREDLIRPVSTALALLHTTSPSYVLMASLEASGAWLASKGHDVMAKGMEKIARLEAALAKENLLSIARHPLWQQDPFKVYLVSPRVSGETLARLLAERGCVAEMTDGTGCLLLIGLDGGDDGLPELLQSLAQDVGNCPQEKKPLPCYAKSLPEMAVSMQEAWLAPQMHLPLEEAEGRIAAEVFEAYPPGIPLLLPGMRVSAEMIDAWRVAGHNPRTPLAVLS